MRALLMVLLGLSLAACPKPESTSTGTDAGASPDPAPPPVATASAAASAAPVAAAAPSAAASATAASNTPDAAPALGKPTATASSKPGALSAAAVDAGPTCGTKPLPDCPLQAWMKRNTAVASASGDLPTLALALDKIATMAPSGYANWASMSKDGATAARGGSLDAARASCTGCHKQYRDKYRAEIRTRAVP